ncbi:hypothetical protein SAMN05216378_0736 [Paenibacillus catalpae]|uniref:Uncharacterized protein n=1 Tax=Paenibacillus catalpae TaxID=1045775 RepID=A0A1I1TXH7_9BACL|nr:hypothetical protein SAMN05216378_0736 [Paenibacillus catalpae]
MKNIRITLTVILSLTILTGWKSPPKQFYRSKMLYQCRLLGTSQDHRILQCVK